MFDQLTLGSKIFNSKDKGYEEYKKLELRRS